MAQNKLWVDNNEGIVCTLNPWYWNENITHNDEGWEDSNEIISYSQVVKNMGVWRYC